MFEKMKALEKNNSAMTLLARNRTVAELHTVSRKSRKLSCC